jgi:hypothetical protein
MMQCWSDNPHARPPFEQLVEELVTLMPRCDFMDMGPYIPEDSHVPDEIKGSLPGYEIMKPPLNHSKSSTDVTVSKKGSKEWLKIPFLKKRSREVPLSRPVSYPNLDFRTEEPPESEEKIYDLAEDFTRTQVKQGGSSIALKHLSGSRDFIGLPEPESIYAVPQDCIADPEWFKHQPTVFDPPRSTESVFSAPDSSAGNRKRQRTCWD